MEIILTHSYFIHDDQKEQSIMKPYPPLGILYIAAYLEKNKMPCEIFDSTFSSFAAQKEYILHNKPKFLCIYTNLMTKLNVIKLIKWIKSNDKLASVNIILGGPDITYNWENYLKTGADYLVIGEGEQSVKHLIESIQKDKPIDDVEGIAWVNNQGIYQKNSARKHLKDIDELPIPARDKIDIPAYLDVWKKYHGQSAINVSTQRGCPFTCKWCSTAVYGQSYRRRSPELVVEEIKLLIEQYQPDSLWFVDDVFTVNYKWIKQLHVEFKKHNIRIPFECITRAERLNENILNYLREMGCFRIWIGAESGSQKIIDAMDRKVDIHQVRSMIKKAREYGIQTGTFIMVGYPGEDEKDIKETVYHLKDSNPDLFTITKAYPIKGTSLYSEIEKDITTQLDWEVSTDRDIDFKRAYNNRYYDFVVKHIVNEVNYSKKVKEDGIFAASTIKYKMKSIVARGIMMLEKRM